MTTTTRPRSLPRLTRGGHDTSEAARARGTSRTITVLALLTIAAVTTYMTYGVVGSWSYALDLRSRQMGALIVVGATVGASSLAFQTIAGSRILTPGVMGFDSVYVLIQTLIVYSLGGSALQLLGVGQRFAMTTAALSLFGVLLFRWLFRAHSQNLFVLVLVGIVLGSFFVGVSTLASRLLSPDDYLTLQSVLFASFRTVDRDLLIITAVAGVIGLVLLQRLVRPLDVIDLGRDNAIALGVNYHRVVTLVLLVVTILVAASTALVGPMLFLGLIVANLTRQMLATHHHRVLIPAAALVGVLSTVLGQLIVTHVFNLNTPLAVIINVVGGVYFIVLLLRKVQL